MIYLTVQNTSRSLGSVDNKVQEADRLRNITANLREQLKQNMSALEEKLKRAKEYVAKVKGFLTFEYLDGRFFQKHNVHELTPVLFCFFFNSYWLYPIRYRGFVQPIKCQTSPLAFRLLPIFSRTYCQLQKYS